MQFPEHVYPNARGCSIRSTLYAYDENLMLDLRRRDAGLLRPFLPTVEFVQAVQMLLVFNLYRPVVFSRRYDSLECLKKLYSLDPREIWWADIPFKVG